MHTDIQTDKQTGIQVDTDVAQLHVYRKHLHIQGRERLVIAF